MSSIPMVRAIDDVDQEVWSDERGRISFRTAVGDGSTPTGDLCSGIARLEPGGWLALHRHEAPEVYQVIAGHGVVVLDGQEHAVQTGSAVYIPSNHEHGIRNDGETPLELVYVYRADSIAQIDYVWSQ